MYVQQRITKTSHLERIRNTQTKKKINKLYIDRSDSIGHLEIIRKKERKKTEGHKERETEKRKKEKIK